MIVFVVSECRGRARERSQRVLDAFLPRVGRRSWSGRISGEGLERLRKALGDGASRSSAIACHRVHGANATKVAWRVGSRSAFDALGRVPVSIKGRALSQDDRKDVAAFAYVRAVAVLAALLHDLGKASKAFQGKLSRKGPSADPVRHELLSVYAVLAALDVAVQDLAVRPDKDLAVCQAMSSGAFVAGLGDVLRGTAVRDRVSACLGGELRLPTPKRHGQVLVDLCHLVMTHHRLASSVVGEGDSIQARPWAYLRGGVHHDREEVSEGCAFAGGPSTFGTAAEVARWSEAVSEAGRNLAGTLQGGAPPRMPRGTVLGLGRLALMLGDHHASAVGNMASRAPRVRGLLYANTPSDPGDVPNAMGQTLARHLVAVAQATGVAATGLGRLLDAMPALSGDEIPDGIREPSPASGRYAWQAEAAAAVASARETRPGNGFLAFAMASTGSGKTRAIPSVLLASRPGSGLRYSVGLGLRSLTLQTANEYTSRLGFHRDGVTVALGSSLARRLDAVRRKLDDGAGQGASKTDAGAAAKADLPTVSPGSDAEEEDVGLMGTLDGDAPVLELPAVVSRMNAVPGRPADARDAGARTFLAAPILVSTLDQLMPVATSTRGGHLTAALRAATSDLVVDEIDDFQPEDVAAICRLVEHAASYGRHVVVSSATLPPPVAKAVHEAYLLGWARHSAMTGKPPGTDVAWISDVQGACRVASPDAASFGKEHATMAGLMADHARRLPWKRRLGYLDTSDVVDMAGFRAKVSDGIRRLHGAHHSVDPTTGRRVSAGVVRMANVRPAMEMAAHLLATGIEGGPEVLVVPYVGTLLPAVRFRVEAALDWLLMRSGAEDPMFAATSLLRARLDDGKDADVAVVVVTTSLEETGRDHDFDWALSEPGSARGVVQIAGRVRRHRDPPPADAPPNVLLLGSCARGIASPDMPLPFSRPGVETPWRNAHDRPPAVTGLASHDAPAIHAGEGWESSITAASLISDATPTSMMAAFERRRWEWLMRDSGGDGLGIVRTRDLAYACDAHQRWRRFRRQDGPQTEVCLRRDGWYVLPEKGAPIKFADRSERIGPLDESRLLVPVDVEASADDLLSRLGATGDERIRDDLLTVSLPGDPSSGKWGIRWHPALGSTSSLG